ncbi:MAG: hypothetical protein HY925_10795 [Elusimicrobia bacterium]|nr:hypothetical protein [Elusimicrobiota bacterium]
MDALVAALKDAHARKDRDGIYALWYTEGADQNSLTFCASIAKDIVESGIANLSYAAPAKTDVYNAKTGTWVHPNLQVLKRLKIQYAKAASNGMLGMDLDIGMKDGSYYFATSIEEKVSAPPTAAARAAAMPAGPAGDEFSTLMDSCRADASFLCEKEKKKKNVAALRQCLTDNTSALTPKCKAALK